MATKALCIFAIILSLLCVPTQLLNISSVRKSLRQLGAQQFNKESERSRLNERFLNVLKNSFTRMNLDSKERDLPTQVYFQNNEVYRPTLNPAVKAGQPETAATVSPKQPTVKPDHQQENLLLHSPQEVQLLQNKRTSRPESSGQNSTVANHKYSDQYPITPTPIDQPVPPSTRMLTAALARPKRAEMDVSPRRVSRPSRERLRSRPGEDQEGENGSAYQALQETKRLFLQNQHLLMRVGGVMFDLTGDNPFSSCPLLTEGLRLPFTSTKSDRAIQWCLRSSTCQKLSEQAQNLCTLVYDSCYLVLRFIQLCPLIQSAQSLQVPSTKSPQVPSATTASQSRPFITVKDLGILLNVLLDVFRELRKPQPARFPAAAPQNPALLLSSETSTPIPAPIASTSTSESVNSSIPMSGSQFSGSPINGTMNITSDSKTESGNASESCFPLPGMTCTFETDFCNLENGSWSRQNGNTRVNNLGPELDADGSKTQFYAVVGSATMLPSGTEFHLKTPEVVLSQPIEVTSFVYFPGPDKGSLLIQIENTKTGAITTLKKISAKNIAGRWTEITFKVRESDSPVRILATGQVSSENLLDVAVDNVTVSPLLCPK